MTDARLVRKCAVAMLGDEYFAHANPDAFARLERWRRRKTLLGILEAKMEEAKRTLKENIYREMFESEGGKAFIANNPIRGLSLAMTAINTTYKAIVRP